jgi:hypothetical protein
VLLLSRGIEDKWRALRKAGETPKVVLFLFLPINIVVSTIINAAMLVVETTRMVVKR